ncbi:tripartite motif-containing protein 16 [Sinocyclocheilus grahami]|uniref:tripartite motif-containing protein 16 n=1 Tax=Sinocyclocheilus grahami TaxID=75366 RepID=UPI0007ACF619|nr:PREDICTED: tripartite motif-containing protein 16-like [Sinocyclocheilus grahami]
MAEASFSQDQFSCSVCLDLLKDPVTIPCGHSYCMSCITDCWKQKRVYRCPQCRHTFTSRPALCKNVIIAEMVAKLKTTDLQTAEPGDVECDVCTGKKYKAVKSCVECLNSYCQSHFEQHENLFKDRRHNLMDPIRRLCPKHNKQLEIYCRTDQQLICFPCLIDEHKNHDTVTAEAERTEKQRLLGETQRKFQQGIQERQNQLQELRDAVKSHKAAVSAYCDAQAAVDDTERTFTQLTRSIERSRSQVIQLIRAQEEAAVSRAEGLLLQLEQEIDDLMSTNAELEQLLHTDDHVHFLQCVYISIIQEHQPRTREQFLQYSCQLTLDSNTMNRFLRLSEENSVATCTDTPQHYPAHPNRFDGCVQVFCKEGVCGRCYWEVEWSGRKSVCISVSYKSISRKQLFGFNNQSWSLFCSSSSYVFRHNNIKTELPVSSRSSRIGVYVDLCVGILSFYSVSDTMSLIHRIQTTFTEPLCPGFGFSSGSSVKLCI